MQIGWIKVVNENIVFLHWTDNNSRIPGLSL